MDTQLRHHLNAARDLYQSGDYDQAEEHLRAVLEHHDGFADVHNMLGVILQQRGDTQAACTSFERALELNPRYNEAALNLSVCYNELGRYEEGKAVYAQAAGERPAPAATAGSPVGHNAELLDDFVRGKIANLHADLGSAYTAVGMLEAATGEYRKALELCPTFVDIRTKLATTLRDAGDTTAALDEFEAITESAPGYLPARIHMGVTLWSLGKRDEARAQWRDVLERDPDNRSVRVYLALEAD